MKKRFENDNKQTFQHYNPSKRLPIIFIAAVLLFIAVFGKTVYVMIADGANLQRKAIDQWYRDVPVDAPRGDILDKNGKVLASTSTLYNVYVRPNAVKSKEATARLLAEVFGYSYDEIFAKISRQASEITVATGATKEQMSALINSGQKGIYYSEDSYRYYPYGDFMTQALGFTGFDGAGQTGLEAYYNKFLTGTKGLVLTESDLVGRELNGRPKYYVPPIKGLDMHTTLDAGVQQIVESAVRSAVTTYDPKGVSCIVMDYTDGDIVSMAEYPSFDLNNVPRDDLETLFLHSKSKLVSTVFEPGSTFKILTAAAALDKGAVTPTDRFYCAGSRVVDGKKIRCWKAGGHGSIDFGEGVEKSCNCVFMDSALRLGTKDYYDYLRRFGLMRKTGVDITGETSGIFIKEDAVKTVDLARIGFGQAVAVTPIGLVAATSSVINDGVKVTPRLLKEFTNSYNGTVIGNSPSEEGERTISSATSDTMRGLLERVVSVGSGKGAYNAGYRIAGKTGTAQKYKNGAIAQGKYISSFLGFSLNPAAPYAVLFTVDEPQGYVYYGSMVAAPAVGKIFGGIFDYLNVPPCFTGEEAEIIGEELKLPDFRGLSLTEAKKELAKLGLYVETDGEGSTVTGQFPAPGAKVDRRNAILLMT